MFYICLGRQLSDMFLPASLLRFTAALVVNWCRSKSWVSTLMGGLTFSSDPRRLTRTRVPHSLLGAALAQPGLWNIHHSCSDLKRRGSRSISWTDVRGTSVVIPGSIPQRHDGRLHLLICKIPDLLLSLLLGHTAKCDCGIDFAGFHFFKKNMSMSRTDRRICEKVASMIVSRITVPCICPQCEKNNRELTKFIGRN